MRNEARFGFRQLLVVYAFTGALFVGVLVVGRRAGLGAAALLRDPAAVEKFHPLTGTLSYAAVFGWMIPSAVALFSATLLPASRQRRLLVSAGALSGLLGLDDLFLIHESLAPGWLGIPETAVFAGYALLTILLVVVFRREIGGYQPWVLVLAGTLFAGSIAIDLFLSAPYLFEDAFKTFGIATWATYWVGLAWQLLNRRIRRIGDNSR